MNTNKTSIQWAEGGVCFPKGFTAHALCAG